MKSEMLDFYDMESNSTGFFLIRKMNDKYGFAVSTSDNGDIDIAFNANDLIHLRDMLTKFIDSENFPEETD